MWNSSTCAAQEIRSASAPFAATFWSYPGNGAVKPRANHSARNANARSVSVMWLSTCRMLHLPGGIPVQRLLLRNFSEEAKTLLQLGLDQRGGVVARRLVDIEEVVGRGFGRQRSSGHADHFIPGASATPRARGTCDHKHFLFWLYIIQFRRIMFYASVSA